MSSSTICRGLAAGALPTVVFRIPATYKPASHPSQPRSAWAQEWQALPARSTFILLMIITFGVMFAWAFIAPQFMFYAYDDLRWTSSQQWLVISVYGRIFMLREFALGQLSDRTGRKPVQVVGLFTLFASPQAVFSAKVPARKL